LEIQCHLSDAAYRYGHKWLFRNLYAHFESGKIHLITGVNGSGKSTLLRLLSSAMELEEGSIRYSIDGRQPDEEKVRNEISFIAPAQELPEEFSLAELIAMQQKFLPSSEASRQNLYSELTARFGLEESRNKPVSEYSTGMKQKAKFVLALGLNRPIWLLDEPGANLDLNSAAQLHGLLRENSGSRLIIMASNDPVETSLGEVIVSL